MGDVFRAISDRVHQLFISYRHKERDRAEPIWRVIKALRPDLSLFIDGEQRQGDGGDDPQRALAPVETACRIAS